ncbi:class I SAM-dependent methyltransferase [Falsirhodobacter sp. 20TX0035]|uniref:class I SAM-dependent methyltransferase n=1 Tax=Falsirhodobacter sp. 20TX0035 TaxID=3022019 RepID=UPI002330825F|nr:class I SAM-dependent methyltransferase [Falsirhodobacter sp. 20TX0035]MDB6453813.1 class I SAM-dependent methyltransferase [Falsirhodobacter sp. 20TX0035]
MYLDVLDLRNFYYRTQLGRVAQRAIRDRLVEMWPEAKGQTVVGFGFAAPLLRPYLDQARRVIAVMPAPQGVMPWPAGMENVSLLAEEASWPLETGMVDKLVVLHGLEPSEEQPDLLDECWRVLGPGGRAIFVVPNRSGFWARTEGTPFGFGRPYSANQLESQLRRHSFVPERAVSALFAPPSHRRFWLRTAGMWERAGRRFAPWLAGGVVMVEVSKQVYAPRKPGLTAAVTRPLKALEGVTVPKPLPAPRAWAVKN